MLVSIVFYYVLEWTLKNYIFFSLSNPISMLFLVVVNDNAFICENVESKKKIRMLYANEKNKNARNNR